MRPAHLTDGTDAVGDFLSIFILFDLVQVTEIQYTAEITLTQCR